MSDITFTNEELMMLSDCILSAMSNVDKAQCLLPTSTARFNEDIRRYEERLSKLNSKICSLITGEEK